MDTSPVPRGGAKTLVPLHVRVAPRAIYYETRRRLTSPHVPRTHAEAVAKAAARKLLAAKALPPGCSETVARIAAAAASAHHAARTLHESPPSLGVRLRKFRTERYLDEAERRGLPVEVDLLRNGVEPLRMVSETRTSGGHHVCLLRAEGWAEYSRAHGFRRRSLALLCGRDDNGPSAVRVPATIRSAEAALLWLEPAAVRKAREAGRKVLRQGDVWIVERPRGCLLHDAALPAGHAWDAAARVLRHDDGHAAVHVPFPAVAIRQSTLAPRGSHRQRGD